MKNQLFVTLGLFAFVAVQQSYGVLVDGHQNYTEKHEVENHVMLISEGAESENSDSSEDEPDLENTTDHAERTGFKYACKQVPQFGRRRFMLKNLLRRNASKLTDEERSHSYFSERRNDTTTSSPTNSTNEFTDRERPQPNISEWRRKHETFLPFPIRNLDGELKFQSRHRYQRRNRTTTSSPTTETSKLTERERPHLYVSEWPKMQVLLPARSMDVEKKFQQHYHYRDLTITRQPTTLAGTTSTDSKNEANLSLIN